MTSSKVNYLDFEIIKEEWTEYISSNDIKIKIKQPMTELTTEDSIESGKKNQFRIECTNGISNGYKQHY